MGLKAILDAIRAEGEAQINKIEAEARTHSYEILANAGMEAEEEKEKVRVTTIAPAVRERARKLHHAHLESLQHIGNVRESLVDSALDRTQGRLAGMRREANYPKILRQLTREALDDLAGSMEGSGEIQIQVDPRDKALMTHILQEMGKELVITYNLKCWGGLIAKSKDGRIVVINTLEARLERATPYLRRLLANLFENAPQEIRDVRHVEEWVLAV